MQIAQPNLIEFQCQSEMLALFHRLWADRLWKDLKDSTLGDIFWL